MAEKKVSVTISAKDAVTGVLKSISQGVKGWSEGVTKIAAGIGLADGFKEIGRFIRDSVKEAAAAYPKLGAGLDTLNNGFKEFRIQAGAAFLEVLQPAIPILQQMFGWATRLAKQLPDAFDGARIVLAQVVGWFEKIPAKAQGAFGAAAVALGDFLRTAAPYLAALGLGGDAAIAGADRLSAFGASQQQEAIKRARGIDAGTASTVSRIASTVHDFGPRALSPEQKAAREKFIQQGLDAADLSLRGAGGPQVVGGGRRPIGLKGIEGQAVAAGELPTGEAFQGMSQGAADFGNALRDALGPLGDFNAEAQNTNQILGTMAGEVVQRLSDSYADLAANLATTGNFFGNFAKIAVKAVAGAAIAEGKIGIAKGFAKIAEGAFPPNPPLLAAGAAMVAKNTALVALAGALSGGGGWGGGGGSGGSLGAGFTSSSGQAASGRGLQEVKIKAEPGTLADPSSAGFARTIAAGLKAAKNARLIEFDFTGAN